MKRGRHITKRKKGIRAKDMFFSSAMIEFAIAIVAFVVASAMPPLIQFEVQSMLETLIRLDGVLFGFSGVMLGLFIRKFESVSQRFLKRCFMLALVSFWSYIFSILFAFINLYFGVQEWFFMPVLLTLSGAICSSVYTVMAFLEEQEPELKEKKI